MKKLLVLLVALSLRAQDFTDVEKTAREEMTKLGVPGIAVAVVRGDQVIYKKGIGVASVETGEAVRPEMLFRLGSTTKMMTATALVSLAVEGKADLEAPIGKYLPFLTPKLAKITANQLLSHTAGIHDEAPMFGSHDETALGAGIHSWTDAWLFTDPGKIFSYSNPGYWMAGYLVETITGKPYADAMEERVFKPFGMARTTLRPTMAITWPLAQGHEAGKVVRPAADNAAGWPAGSVFSNVEDLSRFVTACLNQKNRAFALMSTAHAKEPGSDSSYGYGLTIHTVRGVPIVEHGGSRSGYGSMIRMAPAQKVGIIILANRSGASLPATMTKISELLLPMGPVNADFTHLVAVPAPGVYQNGDQKVEVVAGKPLDRGLVAEGDYVCRGSRCFARVTTK